MSDKRKIISRSNLPHRLPVAFTLALAGRDPLTLKPTDRLRVAHYLNAKEAYHQVKEQDAQAVDKAN